MTQDASLPPEPVNNEYTAEDIHVLGGREAVRRRPGMYIGSTDQRGLHHLVYEITYNCIDEAMVGYCDEIVVTIQQDNTVKVEDNGRGIPIEIHPATNTSALETVMTVLHAGAKFGGRTYQVSGGLHGVGASVVNALSSWLFVDIRRDGKLYQQEYRQGIPQREVKEIGTAEGTGTELEAYSSNAPVRRKINISCNRPGANTLNGQPSPKTSSAREPTHKTSFPPIRIHLSKATSCGLPGFRLDTISAWLVESSSVSTPS